MRFQLVRFIVLSAAVLMLSGHLDGLVNKKLMHCFAFTSIEDASDDDWKAFLEASSNLPEKIEGLNKVWVGKLRRPLRVYTKSGTDTEPEYNENQRQWGVCMEMDDATILGKYADHEAHRDWEEVYFQGPRARHDHLRYFGAVVVRRPRRTLGFRHGWVCLIVANRGQLWPTQVSLGERAGL